jgi:hypothetical protein
MSTVKASSLPTLGDQQRRSSSDRRMTATKRDGAGRRPSEISRINQLVHNTVKKLESNDKSLSAIHISDNWLNDALLKVICDAVVPSQCPVTRFCLRNNSVGALGTGALSRTLISIARVTSVREIFR